MKCDKLKSLKNIECSFNTATQQEQVIAEDRDGNCYGFDSWDEVYLKDEADKVFADLEESHKMEVEQLLMEIAELKSDYKEACDRLQTANLIKDEQLASNRHHKYKRCFAMANLCHWKMGVFIYKKEKSDFYYRWYKRWLEIAEKFKEAK